ncbi:MAG: hypothetical protein JXR37_02760 [Kiritimatiellae bacterium]|nr:hypothetical protein [Kiritimatiellia bacterium]
MKKPHEAILSPRGLLIRAAILALVFGLCHVAGLREYTSFLCGNMATATGKSVFIAFLGFVYVLAFVSFWVFVPVMILGAGLMAAADRLLRGRGRGKQSAGE